MINPYKYSTQLWNFDLGDYHSHLSFRQKDGKTIVVDDNENIVGEVVSEHYDTSIGHFRLSNPAVTTSADVSPVEKKKVSKEVERLRKIVDII